MTRLGRKLLNGFTLIEALLAAVILAMAITAIVMPFSAGVQNEGIDGRRTLAVNLAQGMMEEILTKPFYDSGGSTVLGPEPGETRFAFDNIDDYDGLSEADGQIKNMDGSVVTDPAAKGLSRNVRCAYVHVSGQNLSDAATFIRVTVEIRYNNQPLVTLSRLVFAGH
jgi:type II secretory pathway pseudopilin PulG